MSICINCGKRMRYRRDFCSEYCVNKYFKEDKIMIKAVTVAVAHGEIYEVGQEVNGVVIDDIIQNQDTEIIYCYDSSSNELVKISRGVPTVIEYLMEVENV